MSVKAGGAIIARYRDGTAASVGDFVKGTSYNIKDDHGNNRVVCGLVVSLIDNILKFAFAELIPLDPKFIPPPEPYFICRGIIQKPSGNSEGNPLQLITLLVDYGQAADFEKVL